MHTMSTPYPNEAECAPPPAGRVARRALVLAAVAYRAYLERHADVHEAEDSRVQALSWLAAVGAQSEAEIDELEVLETPVGQMDESTVVDASWRGQGAAVLAWALGRYELPGYDQPADPAAVGEALGFLDDGADDVLRAATLRRHEELEQLAERLLTVHWRIRQFREDGRPMDFASGPGFLQRDGLRYVGGDLAIGELSISATDDQALSRALGLVRERQHAANWLCGDDPVYSGVTRGG